MAFISFASGSGSPTNPNVTYEAAGFGSDGAGTTVTAGASNTKGSPSAALINPTTSNWTGLIFYAAAISAANQRWLFDISFDNGSTWAIQNVYAALSATGQPLLALKIPLIVASGAVIKVQAQCSTAAATVRVAVEGIVGGATNAPGFTTFTNLLADTSTTRPSSINVPFDDDGSSGWTELIPSTAATYGALLAVVDSNGTALGAIQAGTVMLATGTNPNETEFARWMVGFSTATIGVSRGWASPIETSIASSQRISAQIRVATPGTDNGRIGLYGLS